MSVRQRRGKKDSSTVTTTTEEDNGAPVQDKLDKAYLSVVATRENTKELHIKWREYLFRMSLMALLMCFHQIHTPLTECLMEIKDFNNELDDDGNAIPGTQAILIILNDSMCELVGIVLVALSAYFTALRDPPGTFSSWQYLCANAIVPLQLALFYQSKTRKGCIPQGPDLNVFLDAVDEEGNVKERTFPIAIIVNVVISAAYFLMKSGMEQCDANVDTVEKLKRQLKEAQEKNDEAKKASAAKSKKKSAKKK
mmetsp:Transcript_3813/g.5132  ORF Transcript_3813/g.5132 Transcript_3813/m.5132 type:complete len:253 (-) Transcript_3813:137-895(-)